MKYLIWDFDGTLGYRVGMWVAALLDVIRQEEPEYDVPADQLRPYLQAGFPWHTPDQPHLDIKFAEQWWEALDHIFEQAFQGVGFDPPRAQLMAKQVRHVYTNPEHWRLFDDTIPALDRLSLQSWTHIVLSNHVPELRVIIRHLNLESYIANIFNSAETGYEKPHPQAFRNVLEAIGEATAVWMIGDSMNADIAGAESVGIPSILVRKDHKDVKYCCDELSHISTIIGGAESFPQFED